VRIGKVASRVQEQNGGVTVTERLTERSDVVLRHLSRRSFVMRGGVALGAAVAWTSPSVRTTTIVSDSAGTPPPVDPTNAAARQPGTGGRLPLTGIDPKPLIVAGGAAVAAGSALLSVARDPEPLRAEEAD
jgi:hypothetical protein